MKVDTATAAGTWTRETQIARIRQHANVGGALIHIGDLVAERKLSGVDGLTDYHYSEGEVVDIVKGRVVIDHGANPAQWREGTRRFSFVYANFVDVVACCKE